MKRNDKNSSKVNEGTAVDYNSLAQQLKENVTENVRQLLGEQVREAYAAILNESEDDKEEKEYDIEEVDDTDNADDTTEETQETETEETTEEPGEPEQKTEETEENVEVAGTEPDTEGEDAQDADDFEEYKVDDNTYDFRNAKDDDIVKIYKKLTDDDPVTVVRDGNKVEVSDNETGAEYIIELGDEGEPELEITDENETDEMTESRIYEIALDEYDSHVGYTDSYQDKDAMTTDGVNEPGKGRDIDKGVPHNTKKPWSGKKDAAPFNAGKGMTVECGDATADNSAPEVDEHKNKASVRRMGTKSHVPDTSGKAHPKPHVASVAGKYMGSNVEESIVKKADAIFEENKKLKEQLTKITDMLREAAVTNVNLGGIIKLISENSTTQEEKRNIIDRFTNEVHTVEESKSLYRTISDELNKKPSEKKDINEEVKFTAKNADTVNESKFYQDPELMSSLDIMHRICK